MFLKGLIKEVNSVRIVGERIENWEAIEITGLTDDSRFVKKGDLFFCRKGGTVDSHAFAKEAVEKGAAAIVCEKQLPIAFPQVLVDDSREAMALISAEFYGHPSQKLKIIGITGTNGKTTTSYMLSSIIRRAGKSVAVVGTLGIFYGKKRIAPELTTPDPIFLQATLADMALSGVEYVVMEVSAHALHYKKDASIKYAACIFTNLTQDHLDFFADMSAYGEAKKKLFSPQKTPLCILNGDDPFGREIGLQRKEQCRESEDGALYYGLETPCEAFAIVTEETVYGAELVLNLMDGICRVPLSMTGVHNVYNALAAAACAYSLGFTLSEVAEGIRQVKRVKGRLEPVAEFCGGKIFVDFAHTPDGLEKSLRALKKHTKGNLICLFGCGGNRDKTKRPLMGETVAKNADFSVLTSDNPRYEDPLDIIVDIERGYRKYSTRYVIVPDREKAIGYAIDMLKEGDVLLLAGKGGEEYQEIMGIKYVSNDNDIIKKIIRSKGL